MGYHFWCEKCGHNYYTVSKAQWCTPGTHTVYPRFGFCGDCVGDSRQTWNWRGNAVKLACKECRAIFGVVTWSDWAGKRGESTGYCNGCREEYLDEKREQEARDRAELQRIIREIKQRAEREEKRKKEEERKKAREKARQRRLRKEREWNNSWTGMAYNSLSAFGGFLGDAAEAGAESFMENVVHNKDLHDKVWSGLKTTTNVALEVGTVVVKKGVEVGGVVVKQGVDYAVTKYDERYSEIKYDDDENKLAIARVSSPEFEENRVKYLMQQWESEKMDMIKCTKEMVVHIVSKGMKKVGEVIGGALVGAITTVVAPHSLIFGYPAHKVGVAVVWLFGKIFEKIGEKTVGWIFDKIFPDQDEKQEEKFKEEALEMFGYETGTNIEDIDEEDLRKRYKRLAKIEHPDRGGSNEKFIALNGHYDFLMKHVEKNWEEYEKLMMEISMD